VRLPARHPDWEPRLAACVEDWIPRAYTFTLGHDCAAFVLAGIEAVTGEKLALELRPYKTQAGQARALREFGWDDLPAAADTMLGPRIAPLQAHRGDVVSDGSALGLMTAAGPVAFSEAGMVTMERGSIVAAWPVGRSDG
jgi:hypothetical protein